VAFRFSSKLERKIVRKVGAAVGDFEMIQDGDEILVAVSGGKDSLSMLEVLRLLGRRSPVRFSMTAVTIEQGGDLSYTRLLEQHLSERGYRHKVVHVPIDEILERKLAPNTIPCSLCSRIRRGVLYSLAIELGCNKIALGHHLDDLVETLLLNLFHSGQLRSMAPLFRCDDGQNTVIRPLCYVPESWLREYSSQLDLPTTTCALRGCDDQDSRRQRIKRLVTRLAEEVPGLRQQVLRALGNIRTEHLLDRRFIQLRA
jgi:tRNA 2-thiocytidine biosynthesis protein TtcA